MFIAILAASSKVQSVVAKLYFVKKRPRTEMCALLAIQFRISNSRTRWRCNFKGLSQDGGRVYFPKTFTPLSSIKAFRMNPILAGSILLDSNINNCTRCKSLLHEAAARGSFSGENL
jgi:hypothetical protein